MTLKEKILADFKQAFMDKDTLKKSVLSLLKSEISNKEIELLKRDEGLNDEEVVAIVNRAIKQRLDSIQQYQQGGREDLAAEEVKEIEVLKLYQPEQLSDEEIEKEVKAAIEQSGATGKADMGKVMGLAMAKLKGKADGTKVRELVEKSLG